MCAAAGVDFCGLWISRQSHLKPLSLLHRDRRPRLLHLATALGAREFLTQRHVIVSMKIESIVETKAVPLVELMKFVKIL